MHSPLEGLAILEEEVAELRAEVRRRNRDPEAMRREAVQVAAMAVRFVRDVLEEEGEPAEREVEPGDEISEASYIHALRAASKTPMTKKARPWSRPGQSIGRKRSRGDNAPIHTTTQRNWFLNIAHLRLGAPQPVPGRSRQSKSSGWAGC